MVKWPSDRLLIAYSGGKDSLAVLDLAVRAGLQVEAFYMFFLPGLAVSDAICQYAEKRWKIRVHQYQHWNTTYFLRRGVFRPVESDVPKISITDIEFAVRQDSGLEWIAYGYKAIDSLQRRGMMNQWPDGFNHKRKICAPLRAWNHTDVLAYLNRRHINPLGPTGSKSNGIDLTPNCLEWLRAEWPGDYRKILEVFPYAAAQADRAAIIREQQEQQRQARKNQTAEVRVSGNPAIADPAGAV